MLQLTEPGLAPQSVFEALYAQAEDPLSADARDFASILTLGLMERNRGEGTLPDLLGLDHMALEALAQIYFPGADLPDLSLERREPSQEQITLSLLLRWRGGAGTPESVWLADIIARRSMQPNHLWQDLGLPDRATLSALMSRHFRRLVALNTNNMRWKKFFYRQVCADQDFALCLAPTCGECEEYDECFAPETGPALV